MYKLLIEIFFEEFQGYLRQLDRENQTNFRITFSLIR